MIEASAVASKVCAACGGRYPSDALFCPTDGTPLQSAAAAERERETDPYLGQEISGHIEIRQLVGVGAMGRVYRAFQRGIDRDVAVKILHRELSANAQLVSRFTREAKVASRLQHPNVVQVLLAGQLPDRALYMVMEYLDGLSLQSALAAAGGALPLPRALHIALQLCEAAGEAHAQGIVHRDLKPENVMLVRRGADPDYVKVLDFGIARINWGEQSVATAAGLIFGTARYISPEGAQGNQVGPASDVYAIGTLLYQMLSGRTPFDGDQAVGLLVQQIHDPAPDLRSIDRAAYVPEPIADVVMATLVKDPAKREQDARALGQAIFDAAKMAGLSPDEFSRPMLKRQPSAMKMPPMERTKQHDLTPELLERMTPPSPSAAPSTNISATPPSNGKNGGTVPQQPEMGQRQPTAATVKWEPSMEFQVKLQEGIRSSSGAPSSGMQAKATIPKTAESPAHEPVRPRVASTVDETIDDMSLDDGNLRQVPIPSDGSQPHLVTPTPVPAFPARPQSSPDLPRTMPGDPDGPIRTSYEQPAQDLTTSPATQVRQRPQSTPEVITEPRRAAPLAATRSAPPASGSSSSMDSRRKGLIFVLACFVLGVVIALGWAWKVGKIGGGADAEQERFVARATDAMFKNHFHEPPGDNVRDITDEGLRRWPNDRRLLEIRVRAAAELTSQAIAQRSAGDVLEALKLAKIAHELDPHDASAKRLVEQYESEVATFSPSAAPTLIKPPDKPPTVPPSTKPGPGPQPPNPTPTNPQPPRIDYKALLDVSTQSPTLGQTVDLTARIAPAKGDFDAPGFTITGPGIPGGVRMPAQAVSPGVFKASYAFLEKGKFDITFSTQEGGRPITARRSIQADNKTTPPTPTGPPTTPPTAPTPTTTGSVKWM